MVRRLPSGRWAGNLPRLKSEAFQCVGMQEWQAVQEIGEPAIPALSSVLHDRDSSVRMQAIDILGSIGDEKAIPALIRSLADENPEVRWKAVLASRNAVYR